MIWCLPIEHGEMQIQWREHAFPESLLPSPLPLNLQNLRMFQSSIPMRGTHKAVRKDGQIKELLQSLKIKQKESELDLPGFKLCLPPTAKQPACKSPLLALPPPALPNAGLPELAPAAVTAVQPAPSAPLAALPAPLAALPAPATAPAAAALPPPEPALQGVCEQASCLPQLDAGLVEQQSN